jgi:hypothetical protein
VNLDSTDTENVNPTDYISREDVIKILDRNIENEIWDSYKSLLKKIKRSTAKLPSLPDRTSQIKELIEKKMLGHVAIVDSKNQSPECPLTAYIASLASIEVLKELLEEIESSHS